MNDDLISRQAAIALAKDICVPCKDGTTYRHRCIDPQSLMELPSAERRAADCWGCKCPKMERSTEQRGKNISASGFMCSICGFGDFGGFHGYEPKFCPNCGAKMKGDKDAD